MLRNNADARRCSYFELGLPLKERLQGDHCFLHFSRSDSERENSDWSELIKCQSPTSYLFPIDWKQHHAVLVLVKRDEISLREFIVGRH